MINFRKNKVMKLLFQGWFIILLFFYTGSSAQTDTLSFKRQTDTLLKTVESVCFFKNENILFASCINGKPTEKDSNGYIAKVSLTGEILNLKWIEGLNAPKGMAIFEDKLYVSDINDVVEISLDKGEVIRKHKAKDSQFLNDVAVSGLGDVFISDMFTNSIYRLSDERVEIFIQSKELNHPNGLFYKDGYLYIGTADAIMKANLETKEISLVIDNTGSIDGLKMIAENKFLISDWKSKIQTVASEKKNILLNTDYQKYNAADFEYIPHLNLLFVPTFFDNRIMIYELLK